MTATSQTENLLKFIKTIAKYFMDFLETDFHKRRNPNRTIRLSSPDNLLVGIDLKRYPQLATRLWGAIGKGFRDGKIELSKGTNKSTIPVNQLASVKRLAEFIPEDDLQKIRAQLSEEFYSETAQANDLDLPLAALLERARELIGDKIAAPFMARIEDFLERAQIGDEDTIVMLTEELTDVLAGLLEARFAAVIERESGKSGLDIDAQLREAFSTADVKSQIATFFDKYELKDLFGEVFELERNRSILDKQELYLYFYEIVYNRVKYPIFYIPLSAEIGHESLTLTYDSQVFINKRALEFIAQEYNKANGKKATLRAPTERILYLAEHQTDFKEKMRDVLSELLHFFELHGDIDLESSASQTCRGPQVRLSNSLYITIFDKSDEAILNDYEEILALHADSELMQAFGSLIDDFVHAEPLTLNEEIDEEWDLQPVSTRLVSTNPVPLNAEQLKIMSAIGMPQCKYIVVEGPPGTGKSHTIVAIAFNAVMNGKSILVLSDKKEALDVVEEKITDTMNKVRFDDDGEFQNPILRLGKTGSTYSQILSRGQLDKINDHYRAVERQTHKKTSLPKMIEKTKTALMGEIDTEIQAYGTLILTDILAVLQAEQRQLPSAYKTIVDRMEEMRTIITPFDAFDTGSGSESAFLNEFLDDFEPLIENIESVSASFDESVGLLDDFDFFSAEKLEALDKLAKEYRGLRRKAFGYAFQKRAVAAIEEKLRASFPSLAGPLTRTFWCELENILDMFDYAISLEEHLSQRLLSRIDYISMVSRLLKDRDLLAQLVAFRKLGEQWINQRKLIADAFNRLPVFDFYSEAERLQNIVTTQVTHTLDGRVIDFYNNSRSTAKTLRDIIRKKKKFPREEFEKLRQAFPCILAGVRDYAEYIPLEPNLFDLVIIDEASQVSIAQAFPALLRAKKVIVFGDKKQFSNVKSNQARTDINREYLNNLESTFRALISTDEAKLERLAKFNIKTSILEFFEFISNYDAQLRKHFRGYRELVSFSNKNFYNNSLQVMKIRGKDIDQVIRFLPIEHDGKKELRPNTNTLELEQIASELQAIKQKGLGVSVGIITPHTNQQRFINEFINKLPDSDYYFRKLNLKIMTFDTCQGEERDIIFYSMVATQYDDKLGYIFPRDLKEINLEEDSSIAAQRLNVGLSRSKECMCFVLSKSIDEFSGAIGDALRHYSGQIEDSHRERSTSEVDQKSPMEQNVLNWFYQTGFWQENKDTVELWPQYPIGEYLRQLDPTYRHPKYRVDFLLIFRSTDGAEKKIIIEYDGFKEHFLHLEGQPAPEYGNYYYSDEDVYRQKILEGYGYKFLRINRFNLGVDPIATLNDRLYKLIDPESQVSLMPNDDPFLRGIDDAIRGLRQGKLKECPRCGQLKDLACFHDDSLASGLGRICTECKAKAVKSGKKTKAIKSVKKAKAVKPMKPMKKAPARHPNRQCPRCGSSMVRRKGPYGSFYGCSRFPYCRGTRRI